jgi:hypothetical protein
VKPAIVLYFARAQLKCIRPEPTPTPNGLTVCTPWLEGDKIADSVKSDTDLKSSECKVENEPSWEEASHEPK